MLPEGIFNSNWAADEPDEPDVELAKLVKGTIGLNFLVVLDDVIADAGKGITVADGGAD